MANAVTPWFSEQATVEIGAVVAAVSSSSTLDSQHSGTDLTANVKDLSITGGDRDADAVKLLGYNEFLDKKRATVVQCSFTNVFTDKDFAQFLMGTAQAVTGNYKRMIGGEKSSNDRSARGVLVKLANGTNNVVILLNNALCTSRELSLAADGTVEEKVTFKCLASDYYEEDDFG